MPGCESKSPYGLYEQAYVYSQVFSQ